MKRIAITLNRKALDVKKRMFVNGIFQNIYSLYNLLQSTGKYEVSIIVDRSTTDIKEDYRDFTQVKKDIKEIYPNLDICHKEVMFGLDDRSKFDVMLEVGYMFGSEDIEIVRKANPGIKVAMISYGNIYFGAAETLTNGSDKAPPDFAQNRDGVWISPHFAETLSWYETMYGAKGAIAPYIWSPKFVDQQLKDAGLEKEDLQKKSRKLVSVMEPNLGIVKTCMIPAAIFENLYNRTQDEELGCYLFNSHKLIQNKTAIALFNRMKTVKDKKIYFEKRFHFSDIFSKYCGTLLSHQHHCELNYLYLEAFHLDVPLVHNSHAFKDAGFYYEGFNVSQGADQLQKAIDDPRTELINGEAGKDYIWKHSPENPDNVQGYVDLIEGLFTD